MRPVPQAILNDLAGRFGYMPGALKKLGGGNPDSDGIAYMADRAGRPYVLKIVGGDTANADAVFCIETRAAFFAYLGENGVDAVAPERNKSGRLTETATADEHRFTAYTYPYLEGVNLSPEQWTDEILTAWGKMIGLSHRLTKTYPIWEGVVSPNTGATLLTWRQEVEGFTQWCEDEDVKAFWDRLKRRLTAMPRTRETSGFIHNDPHMQNVLFDRGRVRLLDFDVASCHFFACDLAIAIQSALFTVAGGMERPVHDPDALKRFVDRLIDGYRMEMDVPQDLLEQIELFIAYRRALLFTVMQDWLKTKEEYYANWKKRTLEAQRLLTW